MFSVQSLHFTIKTSTCLLLSSVLCAACAACTVSSSNINQPTSSPTSSNPTKPLPAEQQAMLAAYQKSLDTWNKHPSRQSTYQYITTTDAPKGFTIEVKYSVKNNAVTTYDFHAFISNGLTAEAIGNRSLPEDEHEDETSILKKPELITRTLDAVYAECSALLHRSSDDNHLFFEVFTTDDARNGLIKTCGAEETDCFDHCFDGVHIKDIVF